MVGALANLRCTILFMLQLSERARMSDKSLIRKNSVSGCSMSRIDFASPCEARSCGDVCTALMLQAHL